MLVIHRVLITELYATVAHQIESHKLFLSAILIFNMAKQELLSILITFVVGFFAGSYLYLNYFTPLVVPEGVGTREEQEAFEIVSQAYGGCRSGCPAFRVAADGTYRYQYTETLGADPVLRSGTLPRSIQSDIRRNIDVRDISTQTALSDTTDCASAVDGIDIRYDITIDGATYRLDSCQTTVDFGSDAWITLSDIWTYFNSLSE